MTQGEAVVMKGVESAGWTRVRCALAAMFALVACGAPSVGEGAPPAAVAPAQGASLFATVADVHWGLPNRLKEISGLAVTRDGRLLAHGDERAVVSEIDIASGRLVKSFSVGSPVEPGDFEGIAVGERDAVYLIDSAGRVLRFAEGANDASVPFEAFDTGLANICEVEGLAFLPAQQSLIIACKVNHGQGMKKKVALYAWSVRTRTLAPQPWLVTRAATIAAAAGVDEFHPSSVEIDPATGRVILLAGRENAMAELNPDGTLVAARRLGETHNQAEGGAIMPDGALVIADEGASGLRGGVSRYPRAHD